MPSPWASGASRNPSSPPLAPGFHRNGSWHRAACMAATPVVSHCHSILLLQAGQCDYAERVQCADGNLGSHAALTVRPPTVRSIRRAAARLQCAGPRLLLGLIALLPASNPVAAQDAPTSKPAARLNEPLKHPTTAQTTQPASAPADRKLGDYQQILSGLLNPCAVAIDATGRIYIAESGRHQISVFDKKGKPVLTLGRKGAGEGELYFPSGVAIAPDDEVYVSDTGNHRIVVFNRAGQFLRSWGSHGSGPGQFIGPMGLAVSKDLIYIADSGNDCVRLFGRDAKVLPKVGEFGLKPGQFQRPIGIALDAKSNVHVLDRDNSRVQLFDAALGSPRPWGEWGPFPGMVSAPSGFCIHQDRIYVADTSNHRIQVMDLRGRPLYQWGIHAFMPREGNGKLHFPNAIAVAPDGSFAVVCEGFENRCQIFGLMPPGESPPTSPFVQNDPSGQSHFGPSAGLSGNLVALSEEEIDQVSIHNLLDGAAVRIAMVGQHGIRPGQFIRPSGLDLDAKGSTLVVGDAGNRRLHLFSLKQDPPGQLRFIPQMAQLTQTIDFAALRHTTPELRDRPVVEPTVVRRDHKGNLYVLDAIQGVIVVLDPKLKVSQVWPRPSATAPRWIHPTDLALDPAGSTVYISDAGRGSVHSYSLRGRPRHEWKTADLTAPGGVAVKADGTVFVSDEFSSRIFKFDGKGALLESWGSEGLGIGQL